MSESKPPAAADGADEPDPVDLDAEPVQSVAADDGDADVADESEPVDLDGQPTRSRLDRALGRLPYLLSSRSIILFGILLFFYLFVFAGLATLFGHPGAVSTNTQLIFGNYTNVTSSVGAGIAAGASLTLLKHQRHAHRVSQAALDAAREARAFAQETHRLMHTLHAEQAAKLGQTPGELSHHRLSGQR
jgi:hypothetical protein